MKCVYGGRTPRHNQFSRMDTLPNFVTPCAPLRALRARVNSAVNQHVRNFFLGTTPPLSTAVSSDTGMLNKDAIYGPVIGVLGMIVISALIYFVLKHQRRK